MEISLTTAAYAGYFVGFVAGAIFGALVYKKWGPVPDQVIYWCSGQDRRAD